MSKAGYNKGLVIFTKTFCTIRLSVDGLIRDGTGQISRDAQTKRVQTHGIRLAEPKTHGQCL